MMYYTVNEELVARLRQFVENEMRSCPMDRTRPLFRIVV